MSKLISFLGLFLPLLIFAQPITFFKADQTGYTNSKIYTEIHVQHELQADGFLIGFELNQTTHWSFAYAYYDKYGDIQRKNRPHIDYDDPQISYSNILNDNRLLISGRGYDATLGYKYFSYCFDSLGIVKWKYIDSLYLKNVFIESDTNYIGLLEAIDITKEFSKGYHLVRLNKKGVIYWSKPFSELYNQLPTDSFVNINNVVNFIKYKHSYVFSLNDYSNSDQCRIAAFDKDFKLIGEKRDKRISIIHANDKGIIYDTDIGTRLYPRYQIQQLSWDFKPSWKVSGESGEVTSIMQRGFVPIGRNFCFMTNHKDSTYKWLDDVLQVYNYSGQKIRECRYRLEPGFDPTPSRNTKDGGVIMDVTRPTTHSLKAEFMKTDSLGLVYNTDIICDCKDFKTEDTTSTGQYLLPALHAQVFPNPAIDKINVLLSHQQKASITLRNLNGQIVHTQQAELNSNIVDISTLEAGVYIVEVESSSGSEVLKFVKQ